MITNRIVSVFTHIRKAAVLFELKMRNNLTKSLLLAGSLLSPVAANATLKINNWWGTGTATITSANDCNSVYKLSISLTENDAQFQILKDGVEYSNSDKLVLTSDVSAAGFNFKTGSDVTTHAIEHPGAAENVVLYYIQGTDKDTLSTVLPTYAIVGVTGADYTGMGLTTEPTFSAKYCSSDGTDQPASATWQWQLYDKTTKTWSDISTAIEADYAPGASVLADSASVRVVLLNGSDSLKSAPVTATYASAKISFSVSGTDIFATEQQPLYENEIDYGSSFSVTVRAAGSASFTSYKLMARSDISDTYELIQSITAPDSVFTVKPTENLEYQLVAVGSDLRPGRTATAVTVADSFFVRVRFDWDKGAQIDTLFYDNFGTFTTDNDTVYTTYDGKDFVGTMTTSADSTYSIVNFWAPDYFNSVKNHKYALLNPLVGPFSGNCESDGWAHYACWDDGACNGYRVEDGYYAILPNPDYSNCGRAIKDYWNGYDHTYEMVSRPLGGMLFVNCAAGSQKTVLIERKIKLDNSCDNTRLLFTAFVNNATSVSTNKPVNVRLIVRDAEGNVIDEAPSGNIYPRSVKGGQWANLSFMFNAASGGEYTLQLVNNQQGGAADAGNDLLFDDICISVAYPVVNVYRNRAKTNAAPIDTCEEVDVPLYVLNKDDIKKYITNPVYLYQYSKDTLNWVNIGTYTELDSFVVTLSKENKTFWDTTYFRGFAASKQETIDSVLAGKTLDMTCDNIYAVSDPFRVVFDYSGPLDADTYDTLCVGETFTKTVSAHNRPVYRWVDSYTKVAINNQDTTFSYVLKDTDPADTLFYFVTEQRLGCTDTMEVHVHRRLFVDFTTPENFVVCQYDSAAHLTNVFPATGASFIWSSGDFKDTTGVAQLSIPQTLPQQGTFSVKGMAKDYCETTKSFPYDIHNPITVSLTADRADSLFCLGSADVEYALTANTLTGVPTVYYWTYDDVQVAFTNAPVNTYSFGALTEGKHNFGVKVVDEVCNVTGKSEFKLDIPTEVREPITISMVADTAICEDATANAEVTLQHLLNAENTPVAWAVGSANGSLAASTLTTADQKSTNVVTPVPTTSTIEPMQIFASVIDKVCTSNQPVASAVVNVYKKLDVTFATDRTDGLFCMDGTTGITFTATTNRGYVNNYNWYADSVLIASTGHDVNTYTFPVATEGKHLYGVRMSDGVCNTLNGSELAFEVPVETRLPITMQLTAAPTFCENGTLTANVSFEHLLADPTSVVWAVSENGKLQSETTETSASVSSNVISPVSLTESKETVTVMAAVNDVVCPANSPVSQTVTSELHKLVNISLAADGLSGTKCLASAADETNGLTITVLRGDPVYYTWSDGDTTIAPTRQYTLALGDNVITAYAFDSVCSSNGAAALANVAVVTRNPLDLTLFQTVGRNPACLGSPIGLTASVSNEFPGDVTVYQWNPAIGNGQFAHFDANVGDNTVQVAAIADNAICPAQTASINIVGQDSVRISLSAPTSFCQVQDTSEALDLSVNLISGNPQLYVWSTGDTTFLPELSTYPTASQIYSVYAVDPVCDNSFAAFSDVVYVSNMFTLNIAAVDEEVQMGTEAQFTSVVPEGVVPANLIWYTNDQPTGNSSLGTYAQMMPDKGTYKFYAIADGGFCGLVTSNEVEIEVADYYQIPTAFTPYNDNPKNNVFMKGYQVEIFNRYQQLVYEGNDGWDGQYNGKLADPGTYFYRLIKKDGRTLKGTIELVKF